jgi:hypothetical protein
LLVMVDFDALVFAPVYDTFGQPAVLTIGSSSHDVVVIDHSRGITVDEAGSIGVQTIRPAADVRRRALARLGIAAGDLVDGEIEFNATAWRIKSVVENGDELRLILMEALELLVLRFTEAGDRRITQVGDVRILE